MLTRQIIRRSRQGSASKRAEYAGTEQPEQAPWPPYIERANRNYSRQSRSYMPDQTEHPPETSEASRPSAAECVSSKLDSLLTELEDATNQAVAMAIETSSASAVSSLDALTKELDSSAATSISAQDGSSRTWTDPGSSPQEVTGADAPVIDERATGHSKERSAAGTPTDAEFVRSGGTDIASTPVTPGIGCGTTRQTADAEPAGRSPSNDAHARVQPESRKPVGKHATSPRGLSLIAGLKKLGARVGRVACAAVNLLVEPLGRPIARLPKSTRTTVSLFAAYTLLLGAAACGYLAFVRGAPVPAREAPAFDFTHAALPKPPAPDDSHSPGSGHGAGDHSAGHDDAKKKPGATKKPPAKKPTKDKAADSHGGH